jgi:hypothetical protein
MKLDTQATKIAKYFGNGNEKVVGIAIDEGLDFGRLA